MSDFGTKLRQAREGRGVSLRHISDRTKLSIPVLEALERNDRARLPGGIFARALVRSYAAEVGLDPDATVREFIARFGIDPPVHEHEPAQEAAAPGVDRRRILMTVMVMGLVLAAIALLLRMTATPPTDSKAPAGPGGDPQTRAISVVPVAARLRA